MRKEYGDILPDPSDDIRYDLIKHRVPFYLKIKKECETCNGKGIISSKDKKNTVTCGCVKSFEIILEMLKSNFPIQHLGISNEKFFKRDVVEINPHNDNATMPIDFMKMTDMFLSKKRKMINESHSFLFTGNNESGKTYSALYMLENFIRSGYSGHYLRFKNYLNLLNSSYQNMDDRKLLRQIKEVKFLVIDELGKEHGKADYATTELEELIKYRQDSLSCTALISNLDFEDFVKIYGEHVSSAIGKNYHVLVFDPDSNFRKKTRVKWTEI